MQVTVPKWVQLVGLPLLALALWLFISAAQGAIFIFVVATVLALMFNPLIEGLRRWYVPRAVAVLTVFIGFVALIVLFFIVVIPLITQQIVTFSGDLPRYTAVASEQAAVLSRHIPYESWGINLAAETDRWIQQAELFALQVVRSALSYSLDLASAITKLVIIVVVSIYMLIDSERIGRTLARAFPKAIRGDAHTYFSRIQKALAHYIRGQLTVMVVIGASSGFAMWLLGVFGIWPDGAKYAIFFGLLVTITEIIPFVGSLIGAAVPILIALFHSPWAALAVALCFIAIQQIEGHTVIPKVMGQSIRVHPLVIIFAFLAGAELYGFAGALLALPIVALVRETLLFFSPRVRFEGWSLREEPLPLFEEPLPAGPSEKEEAPKDAAASPALADPKP